MVVGSAADRHDVDAKMGDAVGELRLGEHELAMAMPRVRARAIRPR
ncbi:MAG: hypothetical protein IPP18_11990 [Rhodocyclaceae bacterium]|nr:hypothetical protein [Rhodocyclaceae bacterium]